MTEVITFYKTKDPYGELSNMCSGFPLTYDGRKWRTSEALYQALRFEDEKIQELIRAEKSPMAAKIVAKKYRDKAFYDVQNDLDNMVFVLTLKASYDTIWNLLKSTGNKTIIENAGARDHYWGAEYISESKTWRGQNILGRLWEYVRFFEKRSDLYSATIDHFQRKYNINDERIAELIRYSLEKI